LTFIGYLGTYTKGISKGIYSFTLDPNTSTISQPRLAATLTDPTYLAISDNNRFLYANYKVEGKGAIASFSIHHNTGELTLLHTSKSENGSYCHISVNKNNNMLVAASYGDGLIESYHIEENAALSHVISTIQHRGSGPNKERQEKAHTHYAGFSPDEQYIIAVDLGIDSILTYRVTQDQLHEVNRLATAPSSGPRHLVFHPNQQYVYVMAELRPEVIVLQFEKNTGCFKMIQSIRSVPIDFHANNQGSAISISSDGRFVYAANRGHDSIAVFAVDSETGHLTLLQLIGTEGHWPRDFSLDPSEAFLVAANEESGNLTLFARDQQTGRLTLLQGSVSVPYPVCVKFLSYTPNVKN